MNARTDRPSYPGLGHIYPGDYYPNLPFGDYIDSRQPLPEGQPVFDIRDYGAEAAPDRLNTEAIQQAADACGAAGGGVLLVTGGSFCTGTVSLSSHTTLFITPDAELLASRDADQLFLRYEPSCGWDKSCLLLIDCAEDVTVTGGGKISGNGEWFVYEPRQKPSLTPFPVTALPRRDQADRINSVPGTVRYEYRQRIRYAEDKYGEGLPPLRRPAAMCLVMESRHVRFENIILHDAMCWTLNLYGSRDVTIRNTVIDDNRHVANTDGIDITGSSHVTVEHCFVSCADDGIVVKNPDATNRAMEEIHIRNCQVCTVMNAFKIGTETGHDIRGVTVEDCSFSMPDMYPGSVSGISIESCDGSHVSDVSVCRIRMEKILCPLYICLNKRNRYGDPYPDAPESNRYWGGSIRQIRIADISAADVELPCIITGFSATRPDGTRVRKAVEDISIERLHISYRDNEEALSLPDVYPEFLDGYPESNAHGDVDACGIWVRHADQVRLCDVKVSPRTCNGRDIFRFRDAEDVSVS